MDGWREPDGRNDDSTAVVGDHLYLWGGYQDEMPRAHDSAEKRQFSSSVEVFDVNTGCWEQRTTRGTPPLGVCGHSCVAVSLSFTISVVTVVTVTATTTVFTH